MSSSSSPLDLDNERMTIKLTATEVKEKILSLLDQVEAGQEVEITRRGRTIARLVSASGLHALKGSLTGVAMTAGSDEELFTTDAAWTSNEFRRSRRTRGAP